VVFVDAIQLVKAKGAKALLEALSAFEQRTFTISELAREAKVPFASAWRLVRKWEPAGLVETGRVGAGVTVRFKKSPYALHVLELLRANVSPQRFTVGGLKEVFRKKPEVKAAFLFGSVARGEEKLESDIDVALWADKEFDADGLVFDVAEKWGAKIVPLVFADDKELKEFLEGKEYVRIA